MWHPGKIPSRPTGIGRTDSKELFISPGWPFDEYATGWVVIGGPQDLPVLDVVFPKDEARFPSQLSNWTCCGGFHDAPPCQPRKWHPGKIHPRPNNLQRTDGRDFGWSAGWGYDDYATGWKTFNEEYRDLLILDVVYPKPGSRFQQLSNWTCCGGCHDAPPCQPRDVPEHAASSSGT